MSVSKLFDFLVTFTEGSETSRHVFIIHDKPQIFLMIMLKVPALIYLGAGILGMTAAELMTEDKALGIYLAPYALELKVIFVIAVLLIGYAINRRREQQS